MCSPTCLSTSWVYPVDPLTRDRRSHDASLPHDSNVPSQHGARQRVPPRRWRYLTLAPHTHNSLATRQLQTPTRCLRVMTLGSAFASREFRKRERKRFEAHVPRLTCCPQESRGKNKILEKLQTQRFEWQTLSRLSCRQSPYWRVCHSHSEDNYRWCGGSPPRHRSGARPRCRGAIAHDAHATFVCNLNLRETSPASRRLTDTGPNNSRHQDRSVQRLRTCGRQLVCYHTDPHGRRPR